MYDQATNLGNVSEIRSNDTILYFNYINVLVCKIQCFVRLLES